MKTKTPLNTDEMAQSIMPEKLSETGFFNANTQKTVQPNKRPNKKANGSTEQDIIQTIKDLEDVKHERTTKRFSFEIYIDQEETLDEIQHLLKKKYKGKISISKIIRDALEDYLPKLMKQTSK